MASAPARVAIIPRSMAWYASRGRKHPAIISRAEPAVAAWLAWYFLGEQLDAQGWFGSAMILGGVLLGSWVTGESSPAQQESVTARSEGG